MSVSVKQGAYAGVVVVCKLCKAEIYVFKRSLICNFPGIPWHEAHVCCFMAYWLFQCCQVLQALQVADLR